MLIKATYVEQPPGFITQGVWERVSTKDVMSWPEAAFLCLSLVGPQEIANGFALHRCWNDHSVFYCHR